MNLGPDTIAPVEAAHGVERSDATAVNDPETRSLYKKREPIYPKLVHGRFRFAKWVFMALALGVYYLLPFVRWYRGEGAPDQAVLVDFAHRRFYFFFIEIWPQEVYFITGLLILAALALFLVTALFGRVWCGYACPQTVWTDLFIAVERFFEGDRNARMRLAASPLSVSKLGRKTAKHAVWLLIAAATGGAWILYFHDAPDVIRNFFAGTSDPSAYLFFGILTFTTYTLAGTMREQVCTYMCPWPRIQAAMTDEEALNVTYRRDRGEPRGAHKKGEPWEGRGDCIDCNQCVAACPMGIDIRKGPQLECIQCALCIDACNDIMSRVKRPLWLIAYDTDENIERREAGGKSRYRFFRARTTLYAGVLGLVALIMLAGLATRTELDINVLRDRNPNFVVLSDGSIRNGYTVKVLNKSRGERRLALEIEGPEALKARVLGVEDGALLAVGSDRTESFRVFLTIPESAATAPSLALVIAVTDRDTGERASSPSVFQTGQSTP